MTWAESNKSQAAESTAKSEDQPTDGSLVRRLQRGNEDAATRLYLKYARRLMSVARAKSSEELKSRVDAEEIVQSVFRTFFRRAAHGCYDVPPGDDLWKLLLVIALNKVRKAGQYHRAAKRDVRLTKGAQFIDWSQGGSDELAYKQLALVVEELLMTLTPQHRTMMEMRIEGFEVAEIAKRSKRSKRTVERVLQDCKHRLDAWLHEEQ